MQNLRLPSLLMRPVKQDKLPASLKGGSGKLFPLLNQSIRRISWSVEDRGLSYCIVPVKAAWNDPPFLRLLSSAATGTKKRQASRPAAREFTANPGLRRLRHRDRRRFGIRHR